MRGIGASIFFFGGVIPLTWFIVSRFRALKKAADTVYEFEDFPKSDKPPKSKIEQPTEETPVY